jgi:hypothetical protein
LAAAGVHVSPEAAAALAHPTEDAEVDVWPDMEGAVSVFLAMGTQWRWTGAGMAGAFRTGLDYGPLPALATALGVEVTPHLLHDLRTMEMAAVEQWGRK